LITIVARLGQQRSVAVDAFGNAGVHQGLALRARHGGGHAREPLGFKVGTTATNERAITHGSGIVAAPALVTRCIHAVIVAKVSQLGAR
jgi:hypothetical protein